MDNLQILIGKHLQILLGKWLYLANLAKFAGKMVAEQSRSTINI